MTPLEAKKFREICNNLKKLPAFSKVIIRRKKITDHGHVYEKDGMYYINISNTASFSEALYHLAHECAHVLSDMNDTHGPVFALFEECMRNIISFLNGY